MWFLIVLSIWLIGMFIMKIIMKCGLRDYLNRIDNSDDFLSTLFMFLWPVAIPVFVGVQLVIRIHKLADLLSSTIAKQIRRKVLKNY